MNINDPTTAGNLAAPGLLTASADLFARRAHRLGELAAGHPFAAWLDWLARLCSAQHKFAEHYRPESSAASFSLDEPATLATLAGLHAQLVQEMAAGSLPLDDTAATFAARAAACKDLAFGFAIPEERTRQDLLVAAALQIHWTVLARPRSTSIPAEAARNTANCPGCGAAPHASIVMAGDGKAGARYLECSLCASRWNAVRARCTLCDTGEVVNYAALAQWPATQAETCDSCHGYIKTFFQEKDSAVEPMADDLASLALDALVGEQGYGRGGPNLFIAGLASSG